MSTLWRKAGRDLWLGRRRAALVVLAIALGIAAFSAVLSSYAILDRELERGYLASHPASATLSTTALDDATVRAVAASSGVAAAEARRTIGLRIKTGPAKWRSLILFVLADYRAQRLSTITPEAGAWPPGEGEMLLERDAFRVARAAIGDTVTVRTPEGEHRTLRISGRVFDVGQAQARMENVVYGYITRETLPLLGEEPILDQLKILVAETPFDRAHIRTVAEGVKRQLEAGGRSVQRLEIPEPGKHPHAELMALLLLAMSSFGLLALALSGVLVVNLLTALLAAEVRQIGVMKAIGGSRRQIAWIYFGQALLLGVAAVLLALPAGLLGARALSRALADFLNFDLLSLAVPAWVYGLVGLVGITTPLLAAAVPVLRGTRIPVAAALASFGVSARAFGEGALDRALTKVSGLARPVLLALRNSFRRRTRLALTLLTLSTAGIFFLSALNVRSALIGTLDDLFASRHYDLALPLAGMVARDRLEATLAEVPGTKRAEGWIVMDATLGAEQHLTLFGVPPRSGLLELAIREGRDLVPGDRDALVANSTLAARHPEIRVGRSVVLRLGETESTWRVVGIAREAFAPAVAYVSQSALEGVSGNTGKANSARIALASADEAAIDRFREELDPRLEAAGIPALSASSQAESRFSFDQHMVMIYVFLVVVSALLGGVGALGLATTMSLNVLERRREMGVLRAIGATPRMVWSIVVTEGLAIGLSSFVLAALLAGLVSRGLGLLLATRLVRSDLSVATDPRGLWIWLLVSIALSVTASFLPAWHAARAPVREALACE